MALCGTSVRSVHAGATTSRINAPATVSDFVMCGFLESDTEASRICARTRIVEIIDAARGKTRQLRMDFRVIARVVGPQSQIVGREEHTGAPRRTNESRQIERL